MEQQANSGISRFFSQLNQQADAVYKFVTLYNDYMTNIKDYGTGQLINMVEIHTLTAIEENPGITISQLASKWHRTASAITQTVNKLEKRGFVQRRKDADNARNILLYVTEEGDKLSRAHKRYDAIEVTETLLELTKYCSPDEVDSFFKVIDVYNEILEKEF